MSKRFALIGAAGYVAKKHFEAILHFGGTLVAALDKHDNVGILDSYAPNCDFFTEFERFDRHLELLSRQKKGIDYLVVCSPNYLHDAHCRFGLRLGADVICEKPLTLNPWNVDSLQDLEAETGKKVFNILQLRLHPRVIELKKLVDEAPQGERFDVELTYITSRGNWYYSSWKSDISKSGGIATNIGIHFFDMLQWIFGSVLETTVHQRSHDREAGLLILEKANVQWFLSIQADTLPEEAKKTGKKTYRSLKMNGQEWEFSEGFTDLHKESYQQILSGDGFGLSEAKPAIEMVSHVRKLNATMNHDLAHQFCKKPLTLHPFERKTVS